MMLLPLLTFWILIFYARNDLGLKGVGIWAAIWTIAFAIFYSTGLSPLFFVIAQAATDIVLILTIFGGDIPL